MKAFWTLCCIAGLHLFSTTVLAASEPQLQVEPVLRAVKAWDGKGYANYPGGKPELSVLRFTIPANTSLPWHSNPIPNVAYILSGEITVEKQGTGETMRLGPGQALPEMVHAVHRGYTGSSPAVVIVFYAGGEGIPLLEEQ
ncbi:cupin domain-containing protein [Methylobacillus methanolivorans]|uniref:Cupin domain-containing protein n=1 Tax=Methylobacillus methanolivorans TaxID=1848927 RepID=A0ABW8GJR5_9PROT